MASTNDFPTAGVELRHLLVVSDYARSLAFYRDVLGATVVRGFPGTLCFLSFVGSHHDVSTAGGLALQKTAVASQDTTNCSKPCAILTTTIMSACVPG